MAFSDLSWNERSKVMGDMAEGTFLEYAKHKKFSAERYGFDRSKLKLFWKLPNMVKVTPDFACVSKTGFLVEVKGVGRYKTIKLKEEDLEGLKEWAKHTPLYIFVYDSHLKRVSFTPFEDIITLIEYNQYETEHYPDNNKLFYHLPKEDLTWEDAPYGK